MTNSRWSGLRQIRGNYARPDHYFFSPPLLGIPDFVTASECPDHGDAKFEVNAV